MGLFRSPLFMVVGLWLAMAPMLSANPMALRRSVFRIETVSQDRNFVNPWRLKSPDMSSGTGFYIGDGKILTNVTRMTDIFKSFIS